MNATAIEKRLQELELELLHPVVRQSPERLALLLADEFREFGSSGRVFSKSDVIEALRTEAPVLFSISDFRADLLGEGVVLVTYQAIRRDGGEEVVSLRSSIWVMREGGWRMVFHQGTLVES